MGRGWRLQVNPRCIVYGDCRANNVLEFLAMAITIWLSLIECREAGRTQEVILALGDNTSAISWIMKTGTMDREKLSYGAAKFIARKIAELVAESGNFFDSQHLEGKLNGISNRLTFEGNKRFKREKSEDGNLGERTLVYHPVAHDCPTNTQLAHRLLTLFHQDVPSGFQISHLPPQIFSFAQQSVQILEESML